MAEAVNTAVIRELIRAAFDDEEFTIFCFDYFPAVHDEFTQGMGRLVKIQLLLKYCRRNDEFDMLLAFIKEMRPVQYSRFESRLRSPERAPGGAESSGTGVVEIKFGMDHSSFTPEIQAATVRAMAGILDISVDQINVISAMAGSVIMRLEMPAEAINQLNTLYEVGDPIIGDLGIEQITIISIPSGASGPSITGQGWLLGAVGTVVVIALGAGLVLLLSGRDNQPAEVATPEPVAQIDLLTATATPTRVPATPTDAPSNTPVPPEPTEAPVEPAATATDTPLPPSDTPTSIPPTDTPLPPTNTPTNTVVPSAATPTQEPAPICNEAPILLDPPDEQSFPADVRPLLTWESDYQLGPDEYFVVDSAYHPRENPEAIWNDIHWVIARELEVPQYLNGLLAVTSRCVEWTVSVQVQTGVDNNEQRIGDPICPISEPRTYCWDLPSGNGKSTNGGNQIIVPPGNDTGKTPLFAPLNVIVWAIFFLGIILVIGIYALFTELKEQYEMDTEFSVRNE